MGSKRVTQATHIGRTLFCMMVAALLSCSYSLWAQSTDLLDISSGASAASGSYVADKDFSAGTAAYTSTTITTTGVTNPAPEAVYQNQRYGNFTYTLPGFTAGTTYPVRLHFSEFYWTAAGDREFNVLINGTQVLTNFDIFATAGGEFKAVVEQFNAVANSSGQIVIQFVTVVDNASISGIEVESATTSEAPYPGPAAAAIPGTVLAENYDTGGQAVAYNVTATNGTANTYRAQGVDLEAATAPATGNDLGWSAAGQWFKYTVNVATAGTYTVSFLVASPAAVTGAFHLSNAAGTNLSGSVNVPATGGYQTWVTVTASVTLPAGQQTLTLNQDAAGWNIDSIAFASAVVSCTTKPGAPTGLAASGTSSTGTTLNWTATTAPANCSISSYTILKNGASIGTATGTSFNVTGLTASTNYSFTVEATDAAGTSAASSAVSVTTSGTGGGEGPYGGTAAAIPGTVMAENYDTGGQAVGYNVTAVNGSANSYRSDGVDLEAAAAPATGDDIGWTASGQWFRYTVNVASAGTYTVSFLVASPAAVTDGFHISNAGGTNLSGSVNVPATGGYQTWVTVTATVTLPAGQQTLTLNQDAAGWNIDSLAFTTAVAGCTTKPGAPTGLAASGTTTTGTTLNWAATTAPANCSISSYTVLENGASIGTATGTSFAVTGLSAATSYSFTVEATDAAGTSAASGAVNVTTSNGGGGGYVPIANAGFTLTPQSATALRLDNSNFGLGSGNPTDVLNANSSVSQAWALSNSGVTPAGYYNFGVQGANCLTASGTTSGSAVDITGCGGTIGQAWEAVASGTFYTFHPANNTALCLTASGTASGSAAVVNTCNGGTSQEWGLTAVVGTPLPPPQGPIANGGYSLIPQNNTGLMLDDSNSGTGAGNPINVTTPASSVAQNWALSDNGVTPLTYYNMATIGAYCMTASGTTSGSAVVLDGCAGTTGQSWEAVASGTFYTFSPANNTALCLTASGAGSGSAVVVDTCNGTSSQQWALGPIAAPGPPGAGGSNCTNVPNLTVGGTTYAPSWCTEFNSPVGPAPTAGYAYDLGNNGGWGNGEAEVYCGPPGYPTNPTQCPTTFSTATAPAYIDGNGHLIIQPRNVNGTWISTRMNTDGGQTFQYGIIEASIQLPDMNPQGLWPAFWGLGNNINSGVPWPNCGETDILEDWSPAVLGGGGDAAENSTIHTMDTGGNGVSTRYTFPSGQAVNTAFHTYGMIWSPNEIQYFVDNPATPFATLTPNSLPAGDVWPFNQPIFIILNEAVGGLLGGTVPTTTPGPMTVDYVRYYTAQ